MVADRHTHTHTHTERDKLITILPSTPLSGAD